MLVVDASITLAWCFEDESSSATEALLERLVREGGLAPAHWPLEVANGLRFAHRRGRLDDRKVSAARSVLGALPVDVVPIDLRSALALVEIARDHDLTVYDAAYLDLARVRSMPLATVDDRLAVACRAAGVEIAG